MATLFTLDGGTKQVTPAGNRFTKKELNVLLDEHFEVCGCTKDHLAREFVHVLINGVSREFKNQQEYNSKASMWCRAAGAPSDFRVFGPILVCPESQLPEDFVNTVVIGIIVID